MSCLPSDPQGPGLCSSNEKSGPSRQRYFFWSRPRSRECCCCNLLGFECAHTHLNWLIKTKKATNLLPVHCDREKTTKTKTFHSIWTMIKVFPFYLNDISITDQKLFKYFLLVGLWRTPSIHSPNLKWIHEWYENNFLFDAWMLWRFIEIILITKLHLSAFNLIWSYSEQFRRIVVFILIYQFCFWGHLYRDISKSRYNKYFKMISLSLVLSGCVHWISLRYILKLFTFLPTNNL